MVVTREMSADSSKFQMPPVNQCLQDVEIGHVEEIPKMILRFERQTIVYVYKNNEKAWLEYNPH